MQNTNARYRRHDNKSETHLNSPSQMLLVLLAVIGALAYGLFLLNPHNKGDLLPYLLVVSAEAFLLSQALINLWTILAGSYNPRTFSFYSAQENIFKNLYKDDAQSKSVIEGMASVPHAITLNGKRINVDVFVTVYGEPLDVIRKTAMAARDIMGDHKTYILDDGKSDDVRRLAKKLGVEYIRRTDNKGAKAGNVNNALRQTKGDYFVILDADFVAKPNFLYETLPFFANERIAFVQTPQAYDNNDTIISRGAGYAQQVFYKLVQPGKNRFNAVFCVGTNVVFRRQAIEDIGGMYEGSKSEDIWTSYILHQKGYKTVYIPDILAVGQTPDTIKAYSKQQQRWATGGFEIFFYSNPLFRKGLTLDQKFQYLGTTMFYFQGIALASLMVLPMLHIIFGLTPVNLTIGFMTWLMYYIAFYGLQVLVAFYSMEGFRLEAMLLSMVSFPLYIKALFSALLKKDYKWTATNRRDGYDSPFNYMVPQVFIFVILLITTAIGIWRGMRTDTILLSLWWNAINTFVFGVYMWIGIKETRSYAKARRAEKRLMKQQAKLVQEGATA